MSQKVAVLVVRPSHRPKDEVEFFLPKGIKPQNLVAEIPTDNRKATPNSTASRVAQKAYGMDISTDVMKGYVKETKSDTTVYYIPLRGRRGALPQGEWKTKADLPPGIQQALWKKKS